MLNCEKGISVNPCGVCDNCRAIKEGRHIDILEFDAASKTGVDDVREIIDAVRYKPVNARFKIYIIDEVHMFSKAAFNALLKTLEEPPEHAKFIFATTEIRKVPVTILSRCQRFDLKRVDANLLACHFKQIALSENAEIEDEALAIIAKVADGSVRDGLSILDQAIAHSAGKVMAEDVRKMIGLADKMQMFNLFDAIVLGQVDKALISFKNIYDLGADVVVIAQDIMEIIHSISKAKNLPEMLDNPLISAEEKQKIKTWAQDIEIPTLNLAWQIMLKGLSDLKNAPNVFNALE
jgi:DNA polymerase-3 subunit gamma/tau